MSDSDIAFMIVGIIGLYLMVEGLMTLREIRNLLRERRKYYTRRGT